MSQKVLIVRKKARRNFLQQEIAYRAAREIKIFHHLSVYCQKQWNFGPLVIQLVWYILKQLFTSVSVKVVDIYLAASRHGKYPPLFTSTSVNNCLLLHRHERFAGKYTIRKIHPKPNPGTAEWRAFHIPR